MKKNYVDVGLKQILNWILLVDNSLSSYYIIKTWMLVINVLSLYLLRNQDITYIT